jgi:hypothetical protein
VPSYSLVGIFDKIIQLFNVAEFFHLLDFLLFGNHAFPVPETRRRFTLFVN